MSATATHASPLLGVPKVSRAWRGAVEVDDVKDRVRKEARRDAERLLKATMRLPVPTYPSDIAMQLGIKVLEFKLRNEDTLGVLLVEPEGDTRILLNKHYGVLRCRFTCALELGYFARLSPGRQAYERADLRSLRARPRGEDPDELYADEFAGCLLMPENDVRAMSELGLSDLEMALKFWVPRDVVWSRLNSLGLSIDAERAAR
jgi:Zn-dependent peptidase ImmA (M78 family)